MEPLIISSKGQFVGLFKLWNQQLNRKIPTILVEEEKSQGIESASLTNSEKVYAVKNKINDAGHPTEEPAGDNKFMITWTRMDLKE